MSRDYTPPMEWGRGIVFAALWAVLIALGAVPGLILAMLFGLAHVVRRLFPLPLIVTVVGLAVIGLMGRPAAAAACDQTGEASYYCCEHHGRLTASGERFNQHALTAAHRSLAFGTMIRVTRTDTGASVVVRVTDRGPAAWTGRVLDLSLGAAQALGMVQRGVAPVCIELLGEAGN